MTLAETTPNTSSDADHIISVAQELDIQVVWNYSGRGMMGRNCIGLQIDQFSDIGRVMYHLGALNEDPDVNMTVEIFDWRYDNLGRGWVMYWPGIESPEQPEETCPPCPECKSEDTEFRGPHMISGVETSYKGCNACGHTWDPE